MHGHLNVQILWVYTLILKLLTKSEGKYSALKGTKHFHNLIFF